MNNINNSEEYYKVHLTDDIKPNRLLGKITGKLKKREILAFY